LEFALVTLVINMAHLNPVAEIRESRYFKTPNVVTMTLVPMGMALLTVCHGSRSM